jgi:hypothetical protein
MADRIRHTCSRKSAAFAGLVVGTGRLNSPRYSLRFSTAKLFGYPNATIAVVTSSEASAPQWNKPPKGDPPRLQDFEADAE